MLKTSFYIQNYIYKFGNIIFHSVQTDIFKFVKTNYNLSRVCFYPHFVKFQTGYPVSSVPSDLPSQNQFLLELERPASMVEANKRTVIKSTNLPQGCNLKREC